MSTRLRRATLLLLAAALGLGVAWYGGGFAPGHDPAGELARLVPGRRPLLARPSLAAPHAPFEPAAPTVDPAEREAIYARLLAAKVDGAPGAASALSAFYAARGEPGDAERALAEAVDPVDRGAALLALDRPDEALEEFAKALVARPDDPAAWFDRALALEKLQLDGQAKEAWEAFLSREGAGPWADEARERLAAIGRRPEAEPPLDGRKHDAWKALQDQAGPEGLEQWDGLADELARVGDRLLLAELAYLRTLDEAGWRHRAAEIARFRAATAAVFAGRNADAELRALEGSAETYLAVKAVQFAAYSAIVRGDRPVAFAALDRLRDRCLRVGCAEELALAGSDRGTLHQTAGDVDRAMAAYEAASTALPAAFEARHAELLRKMAELANALGAYGDGARRADRAIGLERAHGAPDTLDMALGARAMASRGLNRLATAEALLREGLEVTRALSDRAHEFRFVSQLVELLAEQERLSEAMDLLERTIGRLDSTEYVGQRGLAKAHLARLQLEMHQEAQAREAADEAVELTRGSGLAGARVIALETQARVAARMGDTRAAEKALREAVDVDRARSEKAPDELAGYRSRHRGSGRRFALARILGERGAVREALETFLDGPPGPIGSDECRIGLALDEDRLLAFSISPGGARFESRGVSERPGERGEGESLSLEEGIGTPWGPGRCPDGARRIAVLQPPGSIGSPLAENARRTRPETVIGIALRPESRWPPPPRRESALVLHSPALDRQAAQPPLPGGVREVSALAGLFRSVDELGDSEATPAALAARGSRQDLIHISTHGTSRTGKGTASWLVLAGEGRSGRLRVTDALHLDLGTRRPLVVLSACRTAGPVTDLEGDGGGLPWAFVRAGASGVIATTSTVRDDVAVAFSKHFYSALGRGLPPAEAVAIATNSLEIEGAVDAHSGYVLFF